MADNEHPPSGTPDAEPTPPAGLPAQPGRELSVRPPTGPAAPPPPANAAPVDPEAVRQFQQFQQFQELLRQQQEQGFRQGAPPPPGFLQPWGQPPPKPRPAWQRALRSLGGKLLTAAVVALLLLGAGYFAIDHFLGGPPEQRPAHEVGGGKAETNLIFETDPRNAVQKIYDDIAQDDPTSACGRFTDDARDQFVDHFAGLGGSCEEIVAELNAQVTPGQKSEYANPRFPPTVSTHPTTDTVPVSSCALTVTGGPRLGLLTVSKMKDSVAGQWIVTRHDPEPENCAGAVTPTR